MVRGDFLIGNDRQDDRRQEQEFGEGEDIGGRNAPGEALKYSLEFQQNYADNAESRCDPELIVRYERTDQVGRQCRHLGRDSGGR